MREISITQKTISPNEHFGMNEGEEILIKFRANSFLYNQVRKMVGILVWTRFASL